MRNKFDAQLDILNTELTKMGGMCEEAISLAIKALTERQTGLIERVFETDSRIDDKEREIESLCLKLLLQQQPVASDLRLISSALKMISDIERIGDQAADIAEIAQYVISYSENSEIHIKEMAKEAVKMVTDSIEAFVKKDIALARSVVKYDDIVDTWFDDIKKELIHLISAGNGKGEYYIDLLMIAKYLERIGDHATNIAEWVEFSITGVHVTP